MKRPFGLIFFIIVALLIVRWASNNIDFDETDFNSFFEQYGVSCTGYERAPEFGGGSSRGAGNGGRR